MELTIKKSVDYNYEANFVGALDTTLSDNDIETQIKTQILESNLGVVGRDIRLDLSTNNLTIGAETRKLVHISARWHVREESDDALAFTLREYAPED